MNTTVGFPKPKKKKTITVSKAKKKAWDSFSLYVRTRDAVKTTGTKVWAECVTCRRRNSIKVLQAGHFLPGRRNAILFDERNCHAQCYGCNMYLAGNSIAYFHFMERTYGREGIEELEGLNHTERRMKVPELLEMAEEYKKKLSEL